MSTLTIIGIFIGAVIAPRFTLSMILFALGHTGLAIWALVWFIFGLFSD
jgi:hypothetical protein